MSFVSDVKIMRAAWHREKYVSGGDCYDDVWRRNGWTYLLCIQGAVISNDVPIIWVIYKAAMSC
jgi:hypothetical protein